ncbi:MAG: hypothetical protein L6408_04285 [Nanoarchaeota archaeon]|nr:hypothetical protein [Nanoarchaeota archaeon]
MKMTKGNISWNKGRERRRPERQKFSDKQFLDLHHKKVSAYRMAKILGVSKNAITHRKKKLGIPITGVYIKKISDKQVINLYNLGLSDPKIAEKLKVNVSTVQRRRQKLGFPPHIRIRIRKRLAIKKINRRMFALQKFTDNQFLVLYEKGYSDYKIARKLKVSVTAVNRRRLYLGLPSKCKPFPAVPEKKFTDKEFLKLYNKGLDDMQIAKKLKVAFGAVACRRQKLYLSPNGMRNVFAGSKICRTKQKNMHKKTSSWGGLRA